MQQKDFLSTMRMTSTPLCSHARDLCSERIREVSRILRYVCGRRQWRRLHGAREARAPIFTNSWTRGITVSRRTANKKLSNVYWPSRKRSPERLIVL